MTEEAVESKGRSPVPRGGDPNVRVMRIALVPEEWRKLRAWAAEEDTTIQEILVRILRCALEKRPRTGF